jgi:predicted kinase
VNVSFEDFIQANLQPRTLLITCGLPASLKSGIADQISKIKGYPILRSDIIRREVLKDQDIFDAKIAGNMSNRMSVYDEMFRRADMQASGSVGGVILDATFVTQDLRMHAAEIAAKHDMALVIVETSCPEEVALDRIKKRTKEKYESNAITEEAYIANKNKWQPVDVNAIKQKYPKLKVTYAVVNTCQFGMANWFITKTEKR